MQKSVEMTSFTPDAPRRRVDKSEIERRLADAIADNRLPPGVHLPEGRLAKFFGAGRTVIRDVLRDLAGQHLVTLLPNRGAMVSAPSVEETRQICEARRVIEAAMVRLAASRMRTPDLTKLRRLVEQEEQAWQVGDHHEAVRCSREFHTGLAGLAGNEILAATLQNILSRSSLSAALYGERRDPGCLCHDHFAIIDALEAGDIDRTEALMIEHLTRIEQRMRLDRNQDDVSIEDALRNTP